MRIVNAVEIAATLEPAAFTDLDGKLHKGGIVSHLQYRKVLEQLKSLDADATSDQVEGGMKQILELLGFNADGVAAALKLPTPAFFAVVDDFFEKYRGEKGSVAAEQPVPSPS